MDDEEQMAKRKGGGDEKSGTGTPELMGLGMSHSSKDDN